MTQPSAGSSWARIAAVSGLMTLWTITAHAGISPDELVLLRHDIGRHELRLRVDGEAYVVRGARIDSTGIAFEPDRIEGVSRWQEGEKVAPVPPASPATWDQITAVERRDSGWRRGALIGALVVPLAVYVGVSQDDVEGWAPMFALLSAPLGALGGGIAGALGSVWVPVWRRPPGMGPDPR